MDRYDRADQERLVQQDVEELGQVRSNAEAQEASGRRI